MAPDEFYRFLKEEKRITVLLCGHDHIADVTDLGERADHVCLYYDGHYSYAGGKRNPADLMWGFCDAVLTREGVHIRYIEPEQDIILNDKPHHNPYREQHARFFPRRDL